MGHPIFFTPLDTLNFTITKIVNYLLKGLISNTIINEHKWQHNNEQSNTNLIIMTLFNNKRQ